MRKHWHLTRFEKNVNNHIRGILESIKYPAFEKRSELSASDGQYSYMNTAGIGPCLKTAQKETFRYSEFLTGLGLLSGEGLAHYYTAPGVFKEYISRIIKCKPSEITFFQNSSQAINAVLGSLDLTSKDVILTSDQEHPSGYLPLKNLSERFGTTVYFVPYKKPMSFLNSFESIYKLSKDKIKLVFLSLASYSSGNILPVNEILSMIDRSKTLVYVDAAQYAGLHSIDLSGMKVDFLSFPGHKWYHGSLGTGLLYVSERIADSLRPSWVAYNSVEESDIESDLVFLKGADRFQCGTWDIAKILGLTISMMIVDRFNQEISGFYNDMFNKLYTLIAENPAFIVNTREQMTTRGIIGFKHRKTLPHLLEQQAFEEFRLIVKAINYPEKFPSVRISPGFIHGIEPEERLLEFIRSAGRQ